MKDAHDPIVRCSFTEMRSVGDLQAHPANPNKHPDEQIKLFVEILRYQGCRRPVTVSKRSGYVIRGHGQLMAYKLAGWKKIPVDFQEYESTEAELADLVADNQLQRMSEMQTNTLQEIVGTLDDGQFDLTLTGIPETELEELMTSVGGLKDEPEGDEDEVPEVDDAPPVVKRGDTWILGNHRLQCGDSTNAGDVAALMNGEKADMVFTDPPYNIASHGKNHASKELRGDSYGRLKESEWDKNFDISNVFPQIENNLKPDATCYVSTSHFLLPDILKWMAESFDYSNVCVWSKPNPMPSLSKRHWCWSHEFVAYATNGKHVFNYPSEGNAKSVWDIEKIKKAEFHPTQKPVSIPEHAIVHSSNAGQSVLDLFGGSGSTLIACEKTGRKCFMMELDEKYCEVIIRRWQETTGKEAIHAETGKTFDATKEGG